MIKENHPTIFQTEIKQILQLARGKAQSAVNFAMVEAYWLIGRRIVEEEQKGESKAGYGDYLIRELSIALQNDFGKGFSYANLCNFRQFYMGVPLFMYTLGLIEQTGHS